MSTSKEALGESIALPQEAPQGARTQRRAPYLVFLIALVLILGGGIIANVTQTAGGQINVRQVSFTGTDGIMMSGLLYVPNTATSETPACGVVATHGYFNSHDTMDGFSIEMARRGCVVLAVDQTGHGFSDAPAFANGYGGPDALGYLSSLDIVRKGDIGLIGHSMGGWASVIGAAAHPTSYRSLILLSSSTSTPPLEPIPGTPTFPKNLAVIEAQYTEFSQIMWLEPIGGQLPDSPRMQKVFGLSGPIQVNHVYGSTADGTARVLNLVPTTHPGITFNSEAIGDAVSWFQQTLIGVSSLPASDQIWLWDEIGTLLALIGIGLLLFPVGTMLLRLPFFSELAAAPPVSMAAKGINWVIGAVILILVGVLTFYPFQIFGDNWPVTAIFPQSFTNGIMTWAVGGALIGLVLFTAWHLALNRRQGAQLSNYGITGEENRLEWRKIGKALLLALLVIAAVYIALAFLNWAFNTDVRFWVFNIKPVDAQRFPYWLAYVIPFTLYFLVLNAILHGQLRLAHLALGWQMLINVVVLVIGYVVLEIVEYIPLFAGHTLATVDQPLLTIVGYQFVPIYILVATISTYFFHKTGRIYVGAFITGILVTGIIIASTATQYGVLK